MILITQILTKLKPLFKQECYFAKKRKFQLRNFCNRKAKIDHCWGTTRGNCVACNLIRRPAILNLFFGWGFRKPQYSLKWLLSAVLFH